MRADTKVIRSSDVARCPISSLLPSHYREDGSCRCDEPYKAEFLVVVTIADGPYDPEDTAAELEGSLQALITDAWAETDSELGCNAVTSVEVSQ